MTRSFNGHTERLKDKVPEALINVKDLEYVFEMLAMPPDEETGGEDNHSDI